MGFALAPQQYLTVPGLRRAHVGNFFATIQEPDKCRKKDEAMVLVHGSVKGPDYFLPLQLRSGSGDRTWKGRGASERPPRYQVTTTAGATYLGYTPCTSFPMPTTCRINFATEAFV